MRETTTHQLLAHLGETATLADEAEGDLTYVLRVLEAFIEDEVAIAAFRSEEDKLLFQAIRFGISKSRQRQHKRYEAYNKIADSIENLAVDVVSQTLVDEVLDSLFEGEK